MRHVENAIETHINGSRLGLFPHLPRCTLFGCFAVFHETRWQCPFTVSRLYCALTKKHLVAHRGNTTADNFWIDVMDSVAGGTHIALAIFSLGNSSLDFCAAVGTKLHELGSFVSHRFLRSTSRVATVTHCPSPSKSSRFQKGASVLSVSITNSQALKASAR